MPKIELDNLTPVEFPSEESSDFEFKGSRTKSNDLRSKLGCAASGFANSGGGCFIWGVDDDGNADGGVSPRIGRQDVSDWVDVIMHRVSPPVKYDHRTYDDHCGRGSLDEGNVLVAVSVFPSDAGPHQAPDNKYYIRAGAHTVPASHFLVEAIWARRLIQKPVLIQSLRSKPYSNIVQLGIISISDSPALNVSVSISPESSLPSHYRDLIPINLPLVDRHNPFYLDIDYHKRVRSKLEGMTVDIAYHDYAGNGYDLKRSDSLMALYNPLSLMERDDTALIRVLKTINRTLVFDQNEH